MTDVAAQPSVAIAKSIRYVDLAPEDARVARLAAGMPEYLVDAVDELFAERRDGKESVVSPVMSSVFGMQPTSFAEFATRHAAIFRGAVAS